MVSQSVGDVNVVPKIDHSVAAQIRRLQGFGLRPRLSFEPQSRAETPVRFEVFLDLAVDGAQYLLHILVVKLAVGMVDNGNNHEDLLDQFFPSDRITSAAFSPII